MPENARLRRAWEQLPKTVHGRTLAVRHPDIRPEWVMYVIESPNAYEWIEYSTGHSDDLILHTILMERVPDAGAWVKVVFDGFLDSGEFLTAYQLRDQRAQEDLKDKERRR